MTSSKINESMQTVETTIGELIEIITAIAMETGGSEEEGYRLASLTVQKILQDQRKHQSHASL